MKLGGLALLVVLLNGCDASTGLGQTCTLRDAQGNVWTSAVSSSDDFYDQGATECGGGDVCLRPAASPLDAGLGFCSTGCSSSSDCGGASMPLVCRQVAMDQQFLSTLDAGLLEQYLGGTAAPLLCMTAEAVNQ